MCLISDHNEPTLLQTKVHKQSRDRPLCDQKTSLHLETSFESWGVHGILYTMNSRDINTSFMNRLEFANFVIKMDSCDLEIKVNEPQQVCVIYGKINFTNLVQILTNRTHSRLFHSHYRRMYFKYRFTSRSNFVRFK